MNDVSTAIALGIALATVIFHAGFSLSSLHWLRSHSATKDDIALLGAKLEAAQELNQTQHDSLERRVARLEPRRG